MELNQGRIFRRYCLHGAASVPAAALAAGATTEKAAADCPDCAGIEAVALTAQPVSLPNRPYLDGEVLNLSCPLGPGPRRFAARFPRVVELAGREALTFGLNARGDLARVRVTLFSPAGERFGWLVSAETERWNTVLLDLADCPLTAAAAVSWEFSGEGGAAEIQLSDLRFGDLVDFRFLRGKNLFLPAECAELRPGELRYRFSRGEILCFPVLAETRYTELNARLGVRSTVRLVVRNEGPCEEFWLGFVTDAHPDGPERLLPVHIPCGDLRTVLVDCAAESAGERSPQGPVGVESAAERLGEVLPSAGQTECPSQGLAGAERLYRLRLVPRAERGALTLFEVTFEQETGGLNEEERAFLSAIEDERDNPHPFASQKRIFFPEDFGAKGDGFACDNEPLQRALDEAKVAGGRVVLRTGRRYRASHLRLGSNTDFVLEEGALLLQSPWAEDYPYDVAYGHDRIDADCNWAHNFLVLNRPLLYAAECENVRICGGGEIRMMDDGNDRNVVGFPYWPEHCKGVIHIAPVGCFKVRNLEVRDIDIRHASSYHLFLVRCEQVFLSRLRLTDVRCLSADGIGLCGSKDVTAFACVLRTNDDGVTLFSVYDDPRGRSWWKSTPGEDNGVRRIELDRCLLNSACGGAGKAVSFIPWGSDAPDRRLQEIEHIAVHGCLLRGGHAVGAWPDNPYHGKQPFDNTETDDYSPVFSLRILGNRYDGPTTLACIRARDVVSDCGLVGELDAED